MKGVYLFIIKKLFKGSKNIYKMDVDGKSTVCFAKELGNGLLSFPLWSIFTSIFTFFLFLVFYFFDIQVLPSYFIDFISIYFSVLFKIFFIYLIITFFNSIYTYISKGDINVFYAWLSVINTLLNFFFIILLLYFIFDLDFNKYIQYNFFYIVNIVFHWFLFIYKKLFFFTYQEKKIVFYLNYPILTLIIGIIILLLKVKYWGTIILNLSRIDCYKHVIKK